MPADLHCHTAISDGSDSVEFLLKLAGNIGLSAVAVTDHDYYSGNYHADKLGEKYGIRVINGVECSCRDIVRGNKVHLLCYNCKYPEALNDVLSKVNKARTDSSLKMIKKVSAIYPITEEMVFDCTTGEFCGKQHIMLALMKAGYADEIFGGLFKELFSSKNGSCYIPIEHIDMFEMMSALRDSGGVIVMAHPSVYGSIASLGDLIKAGIHGIELNHPRNKPEDKEIIVQTAAQNNLLLTGGTDFHGYFTPRGRINPLGTCTASDEQLELLIKKSEQLWRDN